MIDNVDTEVEQIFAVLLLRGDEGADVQFQLVEHGFVHNTVAVDEMAEEGRISRWWQGSLQKLLNYGFRWGWLV